MRFLSGALSLSCRHVSVSMRPTAGSLLEEKGTLRKEVRRRLKDITPAQRAQEDVEIQRHLLSPDWFKSANSVCAYLSCSRLCEVCTDDIIADLLSRGAVLYVPRVINSESEMKMLRITSLDDESIDRNSMGILEPKLTLPSGEPREDVMQSSEPLDVIILPGLAFDNGGGRLGRGGGYYDKFLTDYLQLAESKSWKPPVLAALAYSAQILDQEIPMDVSDVHMDILITKDGSKPVQQKQKVGLS